MREVYLNCVYPLVPRMLGLLDRNPNSPTYGCSDRAFWHYGASDFPNARMQEAALTLSLLYTRNYPKSIYFKKEKIGRWAEAGMNFLTEIQNRDGSFNEEYPYEHGFVSTAFPLYALSEAYLILKEACGKLEREDKLLDCFIKAGRWLKRRDELSVVNQQLGCVAALYNVYVVTGDVGFRDSAREKLSKALGVQSEEGWFPEYGGADIGYHSVGLDYLAKYWLKSGDEKALKALKRGYDFLSFFVHPNGSVGGEYGSRNTQYILPHGVEATSKKLPSAAWIRSRILSGLQSGAVVSPLSFDDRYMLYNAYTYLQAYEDASGEDAVTGYEIPPSRYFKEGGLFVLRNSKIHFILNVKKGGVFRLFNQEGLVYSDCGLLGVLSDGRRVSSQWLNAGDTGIKQTSDGCFTVDCFLVEVPYNRLTPGKNIAFRTILTSLGRIKPELVKKLLRGRLITSAKKTPIEYTRSISLGEHLLVVDKVHSDFEFKSLHLADKFSLTHSTSARFFEPQELQTEEFLTENLAGVVNEKKSVTIKRVINMGTGESSATVE